MDETYIRVKGKWVYLYRAVDSSGATIDFLLSAKRDAAAAERFLAKAFGGENHPAPRVINTDEHAGYPPAFVRLKAEETLKENCERVERMCCKFVVEAKAWADDCKFSSSQRIDRE